MRILLLAALALLMPFVDAIAQSPLAPTGTLRAAYLANNPAQAVTDPSTGAPRGTAVDLARELARRTGVQVTMNGLPNPQAVIDAVEKGQADIGFVAYNPERAGPVEFSLTLRPECKKGMLHGVLPHHHQVLVAGELAQTLAGRVIRCLGKESGVNLAGGQPSCHVQQP